MFLETFRFSDTVEWRWKIVPSERTGVWDSTLADLSATMRFNVLSGVGGSQTGPHLLLTATAGTMSEEYRTLTGVDWVHHGEQYLKSTRRSTNNQWSCLRASVTCSLIRRSRISRAVAFWTHWSGMIAEFGRSAKTELPWSSLERMNECTSWSISDEFLSDMTTYLTKSTQ